MYDIIDTITRMILMAFYAIFFVMSVKSYRKAKRDNIEAPKKYFFAFSIFFLITLINYIQTEIDLQLGIYPEIEWVVPLGDPGIVLPFNTMMFIFFFIPSIIPMSFVIEKYFLRWKVFLLTYLGIISFILFAITLVFPEFAAGIIITAVCMALFMVMFLSLYIYMAIKSSGVLRKVALLMLMGWTLQLLAILIPGPEETTFETIFSHIIAIIGTIFLYVGMILSKKAN